MTRFTFLVILSILLCSSLVLAHVFYAGQRSGEEKYRDLLVDGQVVKAGSSGQLRHSVDDLTAGQWFTVVLENLTPWSLYHIYYPDGSWLILTEENHGYVVFFVLSIGPNVVSLWGVDPTDHQNETLLDVKTYYANDNSPQLPDILFGEPVQWFGYRNVFFTLVVIFVLIIVPLTLLNRRRSDK